MAYTYQSFATLGVNLNRQNYGSLDISQVFNSRADLNYYMSKGALKEGVSQYWLDTVPYPYAGQYLALVEETGVTAYILSEKTDGTFEAKEVGKAPVGDDKSIEVAENGTVSIKGFNELTAAEDTFLPQVKWIEATDTVAAHAEIVWVPISAVVKGDGNTITKVTSADGSVIVSETKGENDTVIYDLSVEHPDVPEYAVVADERAEGATSTTYHLTKDGENVDVAIIVPDAYNDTALAGRVGTLENTITDKANATDVYTKTQADDLLNAKANSADVYVKSEVYTKEETDAKIGEAIVAADHLKRVIIDAPTGDETIEDVIDTWLETNGLNAAVADQYIYMVPSGLTADDNKYYEYIVVFEGENRYVEQVGNWEVDLSNYVTNTSLATTLDNYVKIPDLPTDHVTQTELETTLADYALKADIPTDYVSTEDIKAYDTAEVASGKYAAKTTTEQALADRYTKSEVDGLVNVKADVDKVYTKEEADDLLADKADKADTYTKNEVDALIGTPGTPEVGVEGEEDYQPAVAGTGVYQHVYSKDEVTDLIADITGGESAADVLASLNAYKTTNNARVDAVEGKLETVEDGAQVNLIDSVAKEFDVNEEKELKLVRVPVAKLEGLTNEFALDTVNNILGITKVAANKIDGLDSWITTNRDSIEGLYPVKAKNLLDSLNALVTDETSGLNKKVGSLEELTAKQSSRIADLEKAMTWEELK